MKKYLTLLLAGVMALCMLTGCEKGDSSSDSKAADESIDINGAKAKEQAKEFNADSAAKELFYQAATYCTQKDTEGEPVTYAVWGFNLASPDEKQELEKYISDAVKGTIDSGLVNFYFDNGAVTKVEYTSSDGNSGKYPKE